MELMIKHATSENLVFLQQCSAGLLVLLTIAWLTRQWKTRKLHRFPGPFLSNVTDFWRYLDVRKGNHHLTLVKLHRQHGHIVRLGPNAVSISTPDAIPLIYGINRGFIKVDKCSERLKTSLIFV
jgi:hypothetical protein